MYQSKILTVQPSTHYTSHVRGLDILSEEIIIDTHLVLNYFRLFQVVSYPSFNLIIIIYVINL